MRKISVIQPGARLHYAVPQIFAQAGLLRHLYTDMHADHAWLQPLAPLARHPRAPATLRRLMGRRLPPGLSAEQVRDMPLRTLHASVTGGAGRLSQAMLAQLEAAPLGSADAVYTVLVNEDIEVMRRLKDRGVRIIHECMISPDVGLHLLEENKRFPELAVPRDAAEVSAGRARDAEKYALADLVLVPSKFVESAVQALAPAAVAPSLVPYGIDTSAFEKSERTVPGRVLFVGSVGLIKGNPDLAAAARVLACKHPQIEVHVVGPYENEFISHPALAGPHYRGPIPRAQIAQVFAEADVFVLPTIADSFALVQLEALAAGVPVITTPNCGSLVRDGVDGYIVPIRSPEILAERIAEVVGDRGLRERMSQAARARALEFSLPRYAERLLTAIKPTLNRRNT